MKTELIKHKGEENLFSELQTFFRMFLCAHVCAYMFAIFYHVFYTPN